MAQVDKINLFLMKLISHQYENKKEFIKIVMNKDYSDDQKIEILRDNILNSKITEPIGYIEPKYQLDENQTIDDKMKQIKEMDLITSIMKSYNSHYDKYNTLIENISNTIRSKELSSDQKVLGIKNLLL